MFKLFKVGIPIKMIKLFKVRIPMKDDHNSSEFSVEILVIAPKVVEALEYLHTMDILHLDIKPNNIMFTKVFQILKAIEWRDKHIFLLYSVALYLKSNKAGETTLHVKLIDFGLAREVQPQTISRSHA